MDCDRGTANLAFAHDSQTTATDFSPLGHYHVFLMAFLSSGAAINGDEYHLMREGVLQAMEVAQEVSTYLVMCALAPAFKNASTLQTLAHSRLRADSAFRCGGPGARRCGTPTRTHQPSAFEFTPVDVRVRFFCVRRHR